MRQYFAPLSSEELAELTIVFGIVLFVCARRIEALLRPPVPTLHCSLTPEEALQDEAYRILEAGKREYHLVENVGFERYLGAHLVMWESRTRRDTLTKEEIQNIKDKIDFCLIILSLDEKPLKKDLLEKEERLISIRRDIVRMIGPDT